MPDEKKKYTGVKGATIKIYECDVNPKKSKNQKPKI